MNQVHRISSEKVIGIYKTMLLIRFVENRLGELNIEGLIPGFLHLSIGQEAVAAGVMAALKDRDYILSTHRGHGHCLAKGMSEYRLIAEILGKSDGCCKGKGGSMHLCDVEHGVIGTNGIVGANIPLAAGIAFALRYKGDDSVVACFFGDGASNTGAFHEGLNLAAVWKLPVIYVCENNLYAISTRLTKVTLIQDIAERASSYGMPGIAVDGMDPLAVYDATAKAVERA
ncbi:MAG: pyruvate dehydrogenase (acetyl-transferring) E1 component subunit alpha, partial [Thermoproteota archaeon]